MWGLTHLCTACMHLKLTTHDMWDCCPQPAVEQAPCIEALVPSPVSTSTAIKPASMTQRNSTWCAPQCVLPDRPSRGPLQMDMAQLGAHQASVPGSREMAHRQNACCCRVRHDLLCWGSGRALAGMWGGWGLWCLQRVLVAALEDRVVSARDALHAALLQGGTIKASETDLICWMLSNDMHGADDALHGCVSMAAHLL